MRDAVWRPSAIERDAPGGLGVPPSAPRHDVDGTGRKRHAGPVGRLRERERERERELTAVEVLLERHGTISCTISRGAAEPLTTQPLRRQIFPPGATHSPNGWQQGRRFWLRDMRDFWDYSGSSGFRQGG